MTWFGRIFVSANELAELSHRLDDAIAHLDAIEAMGHHRGPAWGRYVQLRTVVIGAQRKVKRWLGLETPFGRGARVDITQQDRHSL